MRRLCPASPVPDVVPPAFASDELLFALPLRCLSASTFVHGDEGLKDVSALPLSYSRLPGRQESNLRHDVVLPAFAVDLESGRGDK